MSRADGGKRKPRDEIAAPAPTEEAPSVTDRPGYVIRRAHQIADLYFVEETAPFGVTPIQFGALLVVRDRPGIDQLRLGHALRCDRTTVSGVVRRLETKRLIRRRTGRTDRRAKALFLTASGKRLLPRLQQAAERAENRILTGLGPGERRRALALLAKAIAAFEAKPRKS